ncbi:MAG: hypothetical protein GY869_10785, partial [Planctomycetes bacterium]|nr:hypothetical protein [Planctomycetota bacterium]
MMPGCGFAPYSIDIYDWQGSTTVGGISIESPDLLSGILTNNSGTDMGGFTRFEGNIPNELEVGEGEYRVLIGATDNLVDPFFAHITAYILTSAAVSYGPIDYDGGWRKDGKNLQNHNNNFNETTIDTTLTEAWTYDFGGGVGAVFNSTPTQGEYAVYYTTSIPYAQKIWAFNIDTGIPVWDSGIKFQPDNAIYGSVPLAANCEVYVGGS